MKKNSKIRTFFLLALCICMIIPNIHVSPIFAETTPGTENTREVDTDSSDTYSDLIDLRDNSRRAGRVWADKSVFKDKISFNMDTDGYDGVIMNTNDFLHMFSALGSSQAVETIQALDVVFILDTSASMSSQGEKQFRHDGEDDEENRVTHIKPGGDPTDEDDVYDVNVNPRLERAVESLNDAIGDLMGASEYNRVSLVTFNLGATTVLPLDRYKATEVKRIDKQTGKVYSNGEFDGEERYLTIAQASNKTDNGRTGARYNNIVTNGTAIMPEGGKYEGGQYANNNDYVVVGRNNKDDRFEQQYYSNRFSDSQGTPDDWKIIEINAVSTTKGDNRRNYIGKSSITGNADYHVLWTEDLDGNSLPYLHTSAGTDTYWGIQEGMNVLKDVPVEDTKLTLYKDTAGNITKTKPAGVKDKDYEEIEIQRQPVIVLLTDGAPNPGSSGSKGYPATNWWDGYIRNTDDATTSSVIARYDDTNGMLVAAAAAYQKQLVEAHYFYGDKFTDDEGNENLPADLNDYQTLIYTMSLCIDDADSQNDNTAHDGQVAQAALNPTSFLKEPGKYTYFTNINNWWNSYHGGSGTVTLRGAVSGGSYTMRHTTGNDNFFTQKGKTIQAKDIDSLDYPTEYIPVEQPSDLRKAFDELLAKFLDKTVFEPVAGPNDVGFDSILTYMDPIGQYMEVKNVKNVLLFGTMYNVTADSDDLVEYYGANDEQITDEEAIENGNYAYSIRHYRIDTSEYEDSQTNPSYKDREKGAFNLSDIDIYLKVTGNYRDESNNSGIESDMGSDQTLYVNIPAAALPIQVATITLDSDGEFLGYATNIGLRDYDKDSNGNLTDEYYIKKMQSTPIRVIYEVGISDDIKTEDKRVDLSKVDAGYLINNRVDGQVYFYSNWYNFAKDGYEGYVATDQYTFGNPVMTFMVNSDPDSEDDNKNRNRYYLFEKSRLLFERPEGYEDDTEGGVVIRKDDGIYYLYYEKYDDEGNLIDEEGNRTDKPIEKQLEMITEGFDASGQDDGQDDGQGGYYYVMIEYYDRQGLVQYALPRRGSEFGSGVSGTENEYLCWYDPETGDQKDYINDEQTPRPDASEGNYYIAAKEGGLRVGDMSAGIGLKANEALGQENKTGTAQTYYMPTISTVSGGGDVVINLYLGNNGRLAVNNNQLLVTKTTVDMNGDNRSADEMEFAYTVKIDKMQNRTDYHAIKVVWEENYSVWRTLVETLELLTNNAGLLMYTSGDKAIYTDEETGQQYYIYVGGSTTSEGDGYSHVYFDYYNTDHSFADMLGGGTVLFLDDAWLVPIDIYDDNVGWNYEDSDRDRIIHRDSENPFPIGKVDPQDIGHAISIGEVDPDDPDQEITKYYRSDISYLTEDLPFDEDGVATFTLKHGEGYLFNGLDGDIEYTVTETLTEDQINEGVLLKKVTHKAHDHKTEPLVEDSSTAVTNTYTTKNFETEHVYEVSGYTTPHFAEEVHYSNYVPKTEKIELEYGEDGFAKVGDQLTYVIYWENYELDDETGAFAAEKVTVTDRLDPGVDYVDADFVEKQEDGTFEEMTNVPDGWTCSHDDSTVTWIMNKARAGESGYVRLMVEIKENANDYWNPYEENDSPPEKDFEVLNRGTVQVGNYSEIHTDIVRTSTGMPHKTETFVDDTEVSLENEKLKENDNGYLVGPTVDTEEQITYSISYVNYKDAEATITVIDKLDPGVDFVSAGWEKKEDAKLNAAEQGESVYYNDDDIEIAYDTDAHAVEWKILNVEGLTEGKVTLIVEVNENAVYGWNYTDDDGIDGEDVEDRDYKIFNRASVQAGNDAARITETVENSLPRPMAVLPNVGGIGTMLLYGSGCLILIGATLYLVLFKRKRTAL